MTKIVFKNDGEIDILAVTTMGVSVKSDSAIGYFGTGLKFAIATILRNGGSITIYSGKDEYLFEKTNKSIRGKDFDVISMNGDNLGFTTQLGRDWEPWMAVREILCNCLDEGGSHGEDLSYEPTEGTTLVVVELDSFTQAYRNRKGFILDTSVKPIAAVNGLEVYEGVTSSLFYKGVKVYTSDKPYMYHYNLTSTTQLTEDRQLKYEGYDNHYTLARGIMSIDNPDFIFKLLRCGDNYREFQLSYSEGKPCEALENEARKTLGKVDKHIPPALARLCKPSMSEQLKEKEDFAIDQIQEIQLEKAKCFLEGMKVYKNDYPIRVLDTLGDGVLGLADRQSNTIYLSSSVFCMGTKYVAGTLYEEYIHLAFGVDDETRAFQDVVINHLMSVGERMSKTPL